MSCSKYQDMTRCAFVLLAGGLIAGFTMGFFYGRGSSNKHTRENVSQLILWESCSEITDAVNSLTLIRKGRIGELADEKEGTLTKEVFALSQTLPDELLFSGKPAHALSVAAKYRNTHPFVTGITNVDEQVTKVLRQVQTAR